MGDTGAGDAGSAIGCRPVVVFDHTLDANPGNEWTPPSDATFDMGLHFPPNSELKFNPSFSFDDAELLFELDGPATDFVARLGDSVGLRTTGNTTVLFVDNVSETLDQSLPARFRLRKVGVSFYAAASPLDLIPLAVASMTSATEPTSLVFANESLEIGGPLKNIQMTRPPAGGWCGPEALVSDFTSAAGVFAVHQENGAETMEPSMGGLTLKASGAAVRVQSIARYNFFDANDATVALHLKDVNLADGAELTFELSQSGVQTIRFEFTKAAEVLSLNAVDVMGLLTPILSPDPVNIHLRFRIENQDIVLETSSDEMTWMSGIEVANLEGMKALEVAVMLTDTSTALESNVTIVKLHGTAPQP